MKELSGNRAGLLRLFYTNPEQSFYMQEIGRILGKKPGNFQRTLNQMTKEGILISEYKANERYFRVNKDYPLYQELKSIVFKTVGVVGSIRDKLIKVDAIDFAFIYGSFARDKENYLSDIDLIIIGKVDEDDLIRELDSLEELLNREINLKLYQQHEFKKAVSQKEPFLLEILRDKKLMVVGDEDRLRKISEG